MVRELNADVIGEEDDVVDIYDFPTEKKRCALHSYFLFRIYLYLSITSRHTHMNTSHEDQMEITWRLEDSL